MGRAGGADGAGEGGFGKMHELAGADAERAGDTLRYQTVAEQTVAEAVAGHLHDAGEGLQSAADFDSKAPLLALSAQTSLQEAPSCRSGLDGEYR